MKNEKKLNVTFLRFYYVEVGMTQSYLYNAMTGKIGNTGNTFLKRLDSLRLNFQILSDYLGSYLI